MRIACDIPFFESPSQIRDFAQGAEGLGYDAINFSEHVAATRDSPFPPGFRFDDMWHEAFTQAAFLAAVTSRIELTTAMALLPLRPTVLAAKQAAEVDLLSGGRLRLGVSLGWNVREVAALGQDPTVRAARFDEQLDVIRRLWSEPSVTYEGRFHRLIDVGISPRPQRAIPIWIGAGAFANAGVPTDSALRRIVRYADGYKMFAPLGLQPEMAAEVVERLRHIAVQEGRDPTSIGIEAKLLTQRTPRDQWASAVQDWRACGVSHISLGNRVTGGTVDDQLRGLEDVMAALG